MIWFSITHSVKKQERYFSLGTVAEPTKSYRATFQHWAVIDWRCMAAWGLLGNPLLCKVSGAKLEHLAIRM